MDNTVTEYNFISLCDDHLTYKATISSANEDKIYYGIVLYCAIGGSYGINPFRDENEAADVVSKMKADEFTYCKDDRDNHRLIFNIGIKFGHQGEKIYQLVFPLYDKKTFEKHIYGINSGRTYKKIVT